MITVASADATAPHMNVTVHAGLESLVLGISIAAALVLAWGVVFGLIAFLRAETQRLRGRPCENAQMQLRRQVGFYLLFGLELLIAADVIETMIQPTLKRLAVLGGVTLLRIIMGYALGKELEHLKA